MRISCHRFRFHRNACKHGGATAVISWARVQISLSFPRAFKQLGMSVDLRKSSNFAAQMCPAMTEKNVHRLTQRSPSLFPPLSSARLQTLWFFNVSDIWLKSARDGAPTSPLSSSKWSSNVVYKGAEVYFLKAPASRLTSLQWARMANHHKESELIKDTGSSKFSAESALLIELYAPGNLSSKMRSGCAEVNLNNYTIRRRSPDEDGKKQPEWIQVDA